MPLDLTLAPLYRINGQEIPSMPGLHAALPPRKAARGREQDRLLVYLLLTGNAVFSSAEYAQTAAGAADAFYQTPGSLTGALRAGAEKINRVLLERNISTSGGGQYATGWLTLGAFRENQGTFLLSGPMHIYIMGRDGTRHIHEPQLSGKGLGLAQSVTIHFSQFALGAGEQILLCGKVPPAWDGALKESTPASYDAARRRLTRLTGEDLNAILIQTAEGRGSMTLLQGIDGTKTASASEPVPLPPATLNLPRVKATSPLPKEESVSPPAHIVQPSAYAIPSQPKETTAAEITSTDFISSKNNAPGRSTARREFPPSIPRARPRASKPEPPAEEKVPAFIAEEAPASRAAREPSERTRQAAKALAGGIRGIRRANERVGTGLQKFLPHLLPGSESGEAFSLSTPTMIFFAVLIPLIVVTVASMVYLRYGRSAQYETYLMQAQELRAQAVALTDPLEQRKAWDHVLLNVNRAEAYRVTTETIALRKEAEDSLDQLLGIRRLQFNPAFRNDLGIEISRMAASETDLFMLDAAHGKVLRAQLTNSGFQIDTAFHCSPGVYGSYTVGPLVDILAMPGVNTINATLLGVDAGGNLLYCAPGQVAQAIPLPPPDTNWGRVTAFTLDAGNLYVLDAPARALWVYPGKDGAFIDRPYFFFGSQTPEKQDVIDLIVTGDVLYMLHADGHISRCSYSRIAGVPTDCVDPLPLINPFPAYQDLNVFSTAHITQMTFAAPPDQSILLLSANDQSVLRLTARSLELQNQLRPTSGSSNPVAAGAVGAMAVGPNHVLYLAVKGQVYFATVIP